jgi:hypothetical protein
MRVTSTCLPCPASACREHFALYGPRRDTHVSALSRTCVRGALRAMWARHELFRPALQWACTPGPYAGSASRCVARWFTRAGFKSHGLGSSHTGWVQVTQAGFSLREPERFALCSPLVHTGWVQVGGKVPPESRVTCSTKSLCLSSEVRMDRDHQSV